MPKSDALDVISEQIEVEGTIKVKRELSILFDNGKKEVWLPLSQIEIADDETGILLPRWLAMSKELI
jgi:hypothetical protein